MDEFVETYFNVYKKPITEMLQEYVSFDVAEFISYRVFAIMFAIRLNKDIKEVTNSMVTNAMVNEAIYGIPEVVKEYMEKNKL